MNDIAIITFHAAYNFGSVLQAVATQEMVDKISNKKSEIINYRFPEQKKIYSLYQHCGLKSEIKNILQLKVHSKRSLRQRRFEDFIATHMNLTKEVESPEEVYQLVQKYKLLICGSDQIWNKHANELQYVSWEYMKPYLGANYNGALISYASSISNMSEEELIYIKPYLSRFNKVSAREKSGAKKLSALLELKINQVVDPTFLLSSEEWVYKLHLSRQCGEKYVLYYTLHGFGDFNNVKPILINIFKKTGMKIKIIAPFYSRQVSGKYYEFETSCGPIEFMNMIYNAEKIITDSFHGTALALNFHKPLVSIVGEGKAEFRKTELLTALGVSELGDSLENVENIFFNDYKYNYNFDKSLLDMKNYSISYMADCLKL